VSGPVRVEVVYASNVQPGDWYAGQIVHEAPTTPVQPFAAAFPVSHVELFTGEDGRRYVQIVAERPPELQPRPLPMGVQVIVIRGVAQ